ncbi:hypothetical protein Tco_0897756 [Tanacetum coccineum]
MTRDSCLITLQCKQTELEKYMVFNDRTIDYDKLERKLNETLGLLAQKEIDIKEGLKLKAYEISVVKGKHDELVKPSLLTKSHYEGLVKEKTKTIHMLAPKGSTFNGRPTFTNLIYLKKAQAEKPCLYEIPYDTSDLANRFTLDREETLTLEKESRSKLDKDLVKSYDYTKQNSLYENFKPPSQEYHEQLTHANESDSFKFVHELKQEMHTDLKYVESLKKEIDELEYDKAEFLNMYDILLQECVSNDVMCSYLHSLSDIDAHTELQCLYHHKVKECECLAQKLSKQTKTVSKEVYNELLRSFAKLEKHSISLELALQQCQEQMKNDTICKENASNVFMKEREQYFEIQDLKAQLQDKNIAISDLKKLIKKIKGKGSNDMVHNYYLEEAKKKAQLQKDKALNTKPSVQQSARLPNTANGNKPKPRNFNQQPRN